MTIIWFAKNALISNDYLPPFLTSKNLLCFINRMHKTYLIPFSSLQYGPSYELTKSPRFYSPRSNAINQLIVALWLLIYTKKPLSTFLKSF